MCWLRLLGSRSSSFSSEKLLFKFQGCPIKVYSIPNSRFFVMIMMNNSTREGLLKPQRGDPTKTFPFEIIFVFLQKIEKQHYEDFRKHHLGSIWRSGDCH